MAMGSPLAFCSRLISLLGSHTLALTSSITASLQGSVPALKHKYSASLSTSKPTWNDLVGDGDRPKTFSSHFPLRVNQRPLSFPTPKAEVLVLGLEPAPVCPERGRGLSVGDGLAQVWQTCLVVPAH